MGAQFTADCEAKGIPLTENLNVTKFMVDEGTVGDWALQGLPSDDLSIQNGIMVTRSARWPLLVDPQGHGKGVLLISDALNHSSIVEGVRVSFGVSGSSSSSLDAGPLAVPRK